MGLFDDLNKAVKMVKDTVNTGEKGADLAKKAEEAVSPTQAASAPEAAASAPAKRQCTAEEAAKIAEAELKNVQNKQRAAENAAKHGAQIASGDLGSMISGGLGLLRDKTKSEKTYKAPDCEVSAPAPTPAASAPTNTRSGRQ